MTVMLSCRVLHNALILMRYNLMLVIQEPIKQRDALFDALPGHQHSLGETSDAGRHCQPSYQSPSDCNGHSQPDEFSRVQIVPVK